MKTKIALILAFLVSALSFAQNAINYTAVIKDNLGNVLANQRIGIEFSILKGATQTNVYTEIHAPTTDTNGIIIVNIGAGTFISGDFSNIDWGRDVHYLNVKINPGNGWINMGATQFMAVPYALYAKSVAGAVRELNDLEDAITILNGNSVYIGVNAGSNDYGTFNENVLNENVSVGFETLKANSLGSKNAAIGYQSLTANTTGLGNTAIGYKTLFANIVGFFNVANGYEAMVSNTDGDYNVANGFSALRDNTTGNYNTADGARTLSRNTKGSFNTANGSKALNFNTIGNYNTANGNNAMELNTSGSYNTATGYNALRNNISGSFNTANGREALFVNTSGKLNTAAGYNALSGNTTGENNTAVGAFAGSLITTGNNNTVIGLLAQVPNGAASNQVRIGNNLVKYAGVQVAWTITSDRRLKSNIQTSNLGLDFIKALKPVVYQRNNDDSKKTEYGFIAQDVEATLKQLKSTTNGLVAIDNDGMYSLRYNDFFAPIVKAMQEQQELIENLQSTVGSQQAKIEGFMAELNDIKILDVRMKHLEAKLKTMDE